MAKETKQTEQAREPETEETEGAAHVVKVNIDEEPELASRYGVMSIPTVLVFQNGQAVNRSVGVQTPAAVKAMLNV